MKKGPKGTINCSINRITRKSPTQLLFGYQPRSMADAKLSAQIQDALD